MHVQTTEATPEELEKCYPIISMQHATQRSATALVKQPICDALGADVQ